MKFVERFPAVVLAVLILFLGVQPTWLVRWGEPTAVSLVAQLPPPPLAIAPVTPKPLATALSEEVLEVPLQ